MIEPIHISSLKAMSRSPLHYQHGLGHRKVTSTMRTGTAVHRIVLEKKEPPIWTATKTRSGKAWAEYVATTERRMVEDTLINSEYDAAMHMAEAVESCAAAMELLTAGQHEKALSWEWLGLPCEGRLDVLTVAGAGDVTDLKSTRDAGSRFLWDLRDLHYVAQLAWYRNGARICGHGIKTCHIVAVENSAPWDVVIYPITEPALIQGEKQCHAWMERLKVCMESDTWPGYSQAPVPIEGTESELDWDGIDDEDAPGWNGGPDALPDGGDVGDLFKGGGR